MPEPALAPPVLCLVHPPMGLQLGIAVSRAFRILDCAASVRKLLD
jgi:hypothetical protein